MPSDKAGPKPSSWMTGGGGGGGIGYGDEHDIRVCAAVAHRGQDGLEVDPRARRAPLQLGFVHVPSSVRLQSLRCWRCCRHRRDHNSVHASAASFAPV